jgi:hypothetical protein
MMAGLSTSAARAGDVILVHSDSKRGKFNVIGQRILKAWQLLGRGSHLTGYSHVMLCVEQGVVIHADGSSVTADPIWKILEGVSPAHFRAYRLPKLADDPKLAARVATEAQRLLGQPYSFVYGRRSRWFGRLLHRDVRHTLPFCSELVATVYSKLGAPLSAGVPDLILPLDIERACKGDDWRDVTSEYLMADVPAPWRGVKIDTPNRTLTVEELLDEGPQKAIFEARAQLFRMLLEQAAATEDSLEQIAQIGRLRLAKAQLLARDPRLLCQEDLDWARRVVAALPGNEEDSSDSLGEDWEAVPGLINLFPHASAEDAPYEGMRSFIDLDRLNREGNVWGAAASWSVAHTALSVLSSLSGLPFTGTAAPAGISETAANELVDLLRPLTRERAERLVSGLAPLHTGDRPYPELASLIQHTLAMQCALTLLRDNSGG